MKDSFVHLHVHSHYSLLDGAIKIPPLVDRAKELGMNALALTEHGNLFSMLQFYQNALSAGIKPIVGYEAYVAPRSRMDKSSTRGIKEAAYHLTLLVRNEHGYRNLLKLASTAYLDGFYYKPRIDKEILAEHADGLLCLSGCLKSELSQLILKDDIENASELAGLYQDIFGKGNFYLELQRHGITEQKKVLEESVRISKRLDIPLVGTNDVHYLRQEDAKSHEIILCINTRKTLNDPDRMRLSTQEFYLKSPEEMRVTFKDIPEALTNTREVADRCNLEMPAKEKHFPKFQLPKKQTAMDHLRKLCNKGLKQRYAKVSDEVQTRLDYELGVIEKTGFAGYFLIVWDFIRFARENDIPVGPGRGSAVGSLVSYCLEITDIDPLEFGLIFERFLNIDRISDPDIDIDFCKDGRDRVLQYVRNHYGAENVAQIITFGTMAARAVLRDVGRVMDIPLDQVDALAKRVPLGPKITLKDALEKEPEFKDLYETDTTIRELVDMGMRLEGLVRNVSTHAAGVVIADKPLPEYVPLYKHGDDISTQFDMNGVAEIGLLKMDFLGLKTLTVIDHTVKLIKKTRNIEVEINRLPLNDKPTYELLSKGMSKGVFQFESVGMRELLQKMQPDRFTDLIASVALYRPGPLGSGMVDMYVQVKHGKEKASYMHPMLEEVLRETNGVILYQEQVMQIANKLAGFSLSESDSLRKAMGKKNREIMVRFEEQFIKGGIKKGINKKTIAEIYQQIVHFSGYGFNKSHSAAYAFIAYQTAYLKANYFKEFMASLMTCDMQDKDKLSDYIEECRKFDVEVLAPNINESYEGFIVSDDKLVFGLAAIKGVGIKAVAPIIQAREAEGAFNDFFNFCERVDLRQVNKAVVEALVKAGAFDSLGGLRSQYLVVLEEALKIGAAAQQDRIKGQKTFFEEFEQAQETEESFKNVALPDIPEWPENELLRYEKEVLGIFVSSHPLAKHEEELKRFSSVTVKDLEKLEDGTKVVIGGLMTSVTRRTIQNGRSKGATMALFKLEDLTGTVNGVAFAETYRKCGRLLDEDAIVFIIGQVDFRREEPSIKANEIIAIDHVEEQLTGSINLRLQAAGLDEDTLCSLRDILLAHPGPCAVFLEIQTPDKTTAKVRVGSSLFVAATKKLRREVSGLLGDGRITCISKHGRT